MTPEGTPRSLGEIVRSAERRVSSEETRELYNGFSQVLATSGTKVRIPLWERVAFRMGFFMKPGRWELHTSITTGEDPGVKVTIVGDGEDKKGRPYMLHVWVDGMRPRGTDSWSVNPEGWNQWETPDRETPGLFGRPEIERLSREELGVFSEVLQRLSQPAAGTS